MKSLKSKVRSGRLASYYDILTSHLEGLFYDLQPPSYIKHCHHKILVIIIRPIGGHQNIPRNTLPISYHNQTAWIILCEAILQTFEMVQGSG
jgi:hypothetical protein